MTERALIRAYALGEMPEQGAYAYERATAVDLPHDLARTIGATCVHQVERDVAVCYRDGQTATLQRGTDWRQGWYLALGWTPYSGIVPEEAEHIDG